MVPSLEDVLAGPPLRKLLFMTQPHVVDGKLKTHWGRALEGTAAETMQARKAERVQATLRGRGVALPAGRQAGSQAGWGLAGRWLGSTSAPPC